jgi:glycosyltransferase involved in cell wall biosynthesis
VLSVSEQVRQHCITVDGFSPGKVSTLYNGIDLAWVDAARADMACRRSLGISEQVPLITTVGNIRRIKGLDILVRAADRVCRRYPAATFLIAGERPQDDYSEELEHLVKSLNLARNVIFAGNREDVLSILKTSDIFCLPSRSEGFSNALIEAMACALPCVATDAGGNAEALIDGLNGYLVQPEDPALLADSIVSLLDSPAKARELGLAARRTVEEQFTFGVMIEHLIHLYADLASSRRLNPARPGENTHKAAERH